MKDCKKLVIDNNGELIEKLKEFDENLPVYVKEKT